MPQAICLGASAVSNVPQGIIWKRPSLLSNDVGGSDGISPPVAKSRISGPLGPFAAVGYEGQPHFLHRTPSTILKLQSLGQSGSHRDFRSSRQLLSQPPGDLIKRKPPKATSPSSLSESPSVPGQIPDGPARLVDPSDLTATPDCTSPSEGKLLVYFSGMDCSGKGILRQMRSLTSSGYDVRSLVLSPEDRSTWQQLVQSAVQLLRKELRTRGSASLVLFGESFGACFALRVARAAPHLIDRLVLLNPATNFPQSSPLISFGASTGLLEYVPNPVFRAAQDIASFLLVKPPERRIMEAGFQLMEGGQGPSSSLEGEEEEEPPRSPIYSVPASTASWRCALLNDVRGLEAWDLRRIPVPTLLVASAEDMLFPSVQECARLAALLPCAVRAILPSSGHSALLEADVDISRVLKVHGFLPEQGLERGPVASPSHRSMPAADTPASSPVEVSAESPALGPAMNSVLVHPTAGVLSTTDSPASQEGKGLQILEAFGVRELALTAPHNEPDLATVHSVPVPFSAIGQGSEIRAGEDASVTGMVRGREISTYSGPREVSDAVFDTFPGQEVKLKALESTLIPTVRLMQSGKPRSTGLDSAGKKRVPPPLVPPLPSDDIYDEFGRIVSPWRFLTSPVVLGESNLQTVREELMEERHGVLFVGNHTLFGIYDTPVMLHELYMRGFRCRGLSHPAHWLSGVGQVMERYGHVRTSPRTAYQLLKNGDSVLLFPGGSREVCKRKNEKYQLLWGEQPEFVRMAARMKAIIVPFCLVGADDAFDILLDPEEVLALPVIGPFISDFYAQQKLSTESDLYPVTRVPGTPLPSLFPVPRELERIYIRFCSPLDTADLASTGKSSERWAETYKEIQRRIESGIEEVQHLRAQDPERELVPRLWGKITRTFL